MTNGTWRAIPPRASSTGAGTVVSRVEIEGDDESGEEVEGVLQSVRAGELAVLLGRERA